MLDKNFYYDFKIEFDNKDLKSIVDFFLFLNKKNIEYEIEKEHIFHLFVPNVINRTNKEINILLSRINKLTNKKYYKCTENPIKLNEDIFIKINNEKHYRIKKESLSCSFQEERENSIKLKRLETHYKYINLNWKFYTVSRLEDLRDALRLGVFYDFPTIEYDLYNFIILNG